MRRSVMTVESFAPEAKALRDHFDERFADPRQARGDRFVWDFWNVPDQYTLLRTPAWHYFPAPLYEAFHQRLVWWGRRTLGCHDISPPWLSCYINGCEQQLHGDLPHGQWAWVFSLTNWQQRTFRGGETLLLKDDVLDYWSGFESQRGVESGELLRVVPPRFNRLTVFDPRIPHGVRRVAGSMDPREGRLVIHGWFVQPRPFIEGPLTTRALQKRIEDLDGVVGRHLEAGLPLAGMISFGFEVGADGKTSRVRVLCDTTRSAPTEDGSRRALLRDVQKTLRGFSFSRQRAPSQVTLPLVFEVG